MNEIAGATIERPPSHVRPQARTRGLGRVYQRGQVWWAQYSFRGKVYRESSYSATRMDAVKLLRKRQAEMGRGRLVGPDAERTTFADLAQMIVDDYRVNQRKSIEQIEAAIKRLRGFFGMSRALDITPDRVTSYIRSRLEGTPRPAKPATVKNELAALKRMFTLAVQAGKVTLRPHFPSLTVHNTRTGFFEEPELRAVLSHLPEYLQPAIEFAYLTGWRKGEIFPLTWRQVDFEAGTVRLEPGTTKNDEGRTFPFAALPALATLLTRQRERTKAVERATGQIIPWVFHRNGRPIKDFRDAWKRACQAAGVPERLVHDLRRTAVRNLERAGVPRSVAMKLTGHKTESIYRRYAIVSEADLSEGVQKLAALHHAVAGAPRTVVPFSEARRERTGTILAQFGGRRRDPQNGQIAQVFEKIGAEAGS